MKMLIALCGIALALTACTEDTPQNNRPRFVEQDRLQNPIVDTEPVDQAVHTEAMTAMRTIANQVKLKATTSSDKAAFYRSISGKLDATKLGKLGLSAGTLNGSYYKASDYSLAIIGNTLTISAANIGSRGRVEPQSFQVP